MPTVKFVESPADGTEAITLAPDPEGQARVLHMGGAEMSITTDEYRACLAGGHVIVVLDEPAETTVDDVRTAIPAQVARPSAPPQPIQPPTTVPTV